MNIDWEAELHQLMQELNLGSPDIKCPQFCPPFERHYPRIRIEKLVGTNYEYEFRYRGPPQSILGSAQAHSNYRQWMCERACTYLRKHYAVLFNEYSLNNTA